MRRAHQQGRREKVKVTLQGAAGPGGSRSLLRRPVKGQPRLFFLSLAAGSFYEPTGSCDGRREPRETCGYALRKKEVHMFWSRFVAPPRDRPVTSSAHKGRSLFSDGLLLQRDNLLLDSGSARSPCKLDLCSFAS